MMISPEVYYEEYLQGKSQTEVLQQINFLRQELGRLKEVVESVENSPEAMIMPSPLTRIKCNREYLEMAKLALEEAGGQYVPTDEELRDQSFNTKLATMHRFTLKIGGFFDGYTKYKYTISGDSVLFDADHSFYLNPSNLPVYEPFSREEFIRGIAALHIGDWKERDENLYVLDGTQWSICIEYEDEKEPVEIYGNNAYPYNFEELIEFLGIENSDADEIGDDPGEEE
jgi:hypothetical protein